ncbi:hypothetical protein Agabi119p4_5193 [Agaricus bisporus var. burnettii]|uniref:Uncharacterized protein n=1 Tax=Agaricus bisporus var. burnettii TaxID=192524 RepID=A0A8H7F4T6_AGABI|nr:hypothetical protein Agabi119p4_5193 [Agaricus bisporus var. burnettii]
MVRNNAWNCQRTLIEYLYLGAKNPRIHNFVLKEVNENTTKVSASSHVVLGSTSLNKKAAIRRSLPLRHYTPYLGPWKTEILERILIRLFWLCLFSYHSRCFKEMTRRANIPLKLHKLHHRRRRMPTLKRFSP